MKVTISILSLIISLTIFLSYKSLSYEKDLSNKKKMIYEKVFKTQEDALKTNTSNKSLNAQFIQAEFNNSGIDLITITK